MLGQKESFGEGQIVANWPRENVLNFTHLGQEAREGAKGKEDVECDVDIVR